VRKLLFLFVVATPAYATPTIARIEPIARAANFSGEVIASKGDEAISVPGGKIRVGQRWRWASVTKQIVATLMMQEVAAGRIDLDKPVSTYLPAFKSANAGTITVRQLLRHQSGLPNPDDTAAGKNGVPAYYAKVDPALQNPLTGFCAGPVKGRPGENWSYNNCDYIVAGALLEAVTGKPLKRLVGERITVPLGLKSLAGFPTSKPTVAGLVKGKAEGRFKFETFGAAAGLYGTAVDLWKFDRALMTGKLLPEARRAEMWDGQPELGFIALGVWSFGAELKGCPMPVRIVERRGAIGGVQVRNFILPDSDVVVIAFTNRDDFDFGEIWQGKGFAFDMLSAAACAS
jgi:CubicO group peptidase (beta-lactamase class C family)